ncbi:MAG TPA: DUF1178 family protein [Pseudorhodoplanes sp.]|nr:DUF1178 family protein [Pseudorhodoplanes sp.]
MIRYALICDKKHEFEAWFSNSADYARQRKRNLVECPICASVKIDKAIMAPAIASRPTEHETIVANEPALAEKAGETATPVAMMSPQERELRRKLKELREHIIRTADNVGKRFPEEARKMHYGEIEHRSIYGEASAEDVKDMLEEGIEFHPLPFLPDDKN